MQEHWKITFPPYLFSSLIISFCALVVVAMQLPLFPCLMILGFVVLGYFDLVKILTSYRQLVLKRNSEGIWSLLNEKGENEVEILPSSYSSAWILLLHLYTPLINKKTFFIVIHNSQSHAGWAKLRKHLKFNKERSFPSLAR